MRLTACPSCARHVRYAESACPFCGVALALTPPPRVVVPSRLGRTATFAFGAALATSGCSATTEPADTGMEIDAAGFNDVAVYGGPDAPTPQPDTGVETDAAAASDAGVDAGSEDDVGTNNDAGFDGGGGVTPLYGGPPGD